MGALTVFKKNRLALVGLIIVAGLLVVGLFAPFLSPYSVREQDLPNRLSQPSWKHPFGRDEFGRDILSRVIFGARVSLWVGLTVVTISAALGILLGSISGYYGGAVDEVIMRVIDILLAFPGILLAIAMAALLGPGLNNVIVALSMISWVAYARLVRGEVLKVREMPYVEAAKVVGASSPRIIFRHILPNIMAPVIVQATLGIAGVIIAEASLSFLGLGVQPPTPSWGNMLSDGILHMMDAPHLTIFPGLAIMVVVLGFNFLGDGLRDALDPRMKTLW
ncbi:MAG: ABC transporter permease [Candidatus Aminicenantes bacterium]|nr:ABC transporter permease [Candidatus Aminicenantes bacterium]